MPAWFKLGKRVLGTNRVREELGRRQHRHDELEDVEHNNRWSKDVVVNV